MKEIFFKCTLLSDVVINNKLATEGNMQTLDYIPGSNFLGIASKLYNELSASDAYQIFHSGKVSFGDGLPIDVNECCYPIPLMVYMKKGAEDIGKDNAYLHHLINENNRPKDNDGYYIQLKQKRSGYVSANGVVQPDLLKTFALKSAQDPNTRSSKEGAMFGFESLKAGQQFMFSVRFYDENFVEKISDALIGIQRIGKSKTAQFGQVQIDKIAPPKMVETINDKEYSLIYAQSNLCFLDPFGQPCIKPTAAQLGFGENAEIDWGLSQIRTYSYSPWNGKRNATSIQRDCIAMGSVFYIKGNPISPSNTVGEYQSEGLGRILINPAFLEGNENGICSFFKMPENKPSGSVSSATVPVTPLGKYLDKLKIEKDKEMKIALAVQSTLAKDKTIKRLLNISASQWSGIRAYATRETNVNKLEKLLFKEKVGYLVHGVSYDKYWGKNKEKNLSDLKSLFNEHVELGNHFLAKYAAEKAKQSRKN